MIIKAYFFLLWFFIAIIFGKYYVILCFNLNQFYISGLDSVWNSLNLHFLHFLIQIITFGRLVTDPFASLFADELGTPKYVNENVLGYFHTFFIRLEIHIFLFFQNVSVDFSLANTFGEYWTELLSASLSSSELPFFIFR